MKNSTKIRIPFNKSTQKFILFIKKSMYYNILLFYRFMFILKYLFVLETSNTPI